MIPPKGNAEFVAAMEQVLDVYRRPYQAEYPVVCMDETPRQLIGETRAALPVRPGEPCKVDYEYGAWAPAMCLWRPNRWPERA